MTQPVFSNNAETVLDADITNVATSISVVDASVFHQYVQDGDGPYYGLHEIVTLVTGSSKEIIHITDANTSTNTLTVIRGQEGTTAQAFSTGDLIEGRLTAAILNGVWTGRAGSFYSGNIGINAVDLVTYRDFEEDAATGNYSVAIGRTARAQASGCIAIGYSAHIKETTSTDALAIGSNAEVHGLSNNAISIGPFADITASPDAIAIGRAAVIATGSDGAVLIGALSETKSDKDVVIGHSAASYNTSFIGVVGIGADVYIHANAEEGIAVGYNSRVEGAQGIGIGANIINRIASTHQITGLSLIGKHVASSDEVLLYSGQESILFSEIVDFKTIASDVVSITLPTGGTFFVDEVGFIPTTIDTSTVNPTISFGNTTTSDEILTATLTTASAIKERDRYGNISALDSINGQTSLTMSVTTGATATTFSGRVYFKGIFVED